MQVKVIYESGAINFAQPLWSKHGSVGLFLAGYKRIKDASMGQLSAWFVKNLGSTYSVLRTRPAFSLLCLST